MPIEIQGKTYYSPSEAAKMLDITTGMLKYYRMDGTVPGSLKIGVITYYTDEDIATGRKRVAEPKKRGPKRRKDKGEGESNSSVISADLDVFVPFSYAAIGA